ncbi:unnamed protein product, partial [Ixodes pacificus]
VFQDENLHDVLQMLMNLMAEHPASMVPAFDCKNGVRAIFKLLGSTNESIRLQALKLLGYFLSRSTHKRKHDVMTPHNLYMLLAERLLLHSDHLTMATYNALYEMLTEHISNQILYTKHSEPESHYRLENPMILKVVATLIRQSKPCEELIEVKKLFLSDMTLLCNNNKENRRTVLQMSVWQEWLVAMAYIHPCNAEEQKISDMVYALFRMLLHHAIKYEYGGWRVWVDTLAIVHSKVSLEEYKLHFAQMYEHFDQRRVDHITDPAVRRQRPISTISGLDRCPPPEQECASQPSREAPPRPDIVQVREGERGEEEEEEERGNVTFPSIVPSTPSQVPDPVPSEDVVPVVVESSDVTGAALPGPAVVCPDVIPVQESSKSLSEEKRPSLPPADGSSPVSDLSGGEQGASPDVVPHPTDPTKAHAADEAAREDADEKLPGEAAESPVEDADVGRMEGVIGEEGDAKRECVPDAAEMSDSNKDDQSASTDSVSAEREELAVGEGSAECEVFEDAQGDDGSEASEEAALPEDAADDAAIVSDHGSHADEADPTEPPAQERPEQKADEGSTEVNSVARDEPEERESRTKSASPAEGPSDSPASVESADETSSTREVVSPAQSPEKLSSEPLGSHLPSIVNPTEELDVPLPPPADDPLPQEGVVMVTAVAEKEEPSSLDAVEDGNEDDGDDRLEAKRTIEQTNLLNAEASGDAAVISESDAEDEAAVEIGGISTIEAQVEIERRHMADLGFSATAPMAESASEDGAQEAGVVRRARSASQTTVEKAVLAPARPKSVEMAPGTTSGSASAGRQLFSAGPSRPPFRIPEFRWSPIHQRLLSDLLFSLETDIQVWRSHNTKTVIDFVNSGENAIFVINTVHLISQLADNIIIACGGLLPLLASATSPNHELDVIEPTQGMAIEVAVAFLQRLVYMTDVLVFASSLSFSDLEAEKNMSSGGILRQCLRLVCTAAVRNCLECRERSCPLTPVTPLTPQTPTSRDPLRPNPIHALIGGVQPSAKVGRPNIVENLGGQSSPIRDPEKLLQDMDVNRLRAVIYRDDETKQAQFLALAVVYFISVLMVSKYRDILEPPSSSSSSSSSSCCSANQQQQQRAEGGHTHHHHAPPNSASAAGPEGEKDEVIVVEEMGSSILANIHSSAAVISTVSCPPPLRDTISSRAGSSRNFAPLLSVCLDGGSQTRDTQVPEPSSRQMLTQPPCPIHAQNTRPTNGGLGMIGDEFMRSASGVGGNLKAGGPEALRLAPLGPSGVTEGPNTREASLTQKLEGALGSVCPLLREIMVDFAPFLSRTLVGSHGQDLLVEGKGEC